MAYPLSPRELQVLIALGEGKTTPEICSELEINRKTVGVYLQRLKQKLELTNINELIRAAALLREGIIPSASNVPQNHSFRLCPRCRKLFSADRPKKVVGELAGYRVLASVLQAQLSKGRGKDI